MLQYMLLALLHTCMHDDSNQYLDFDHNVFGGSTIHCHSVYQCPQSREAYLVGASVSEVLLIAELEGVLHSKPLSFLSCSRTPITCLAVHCCSSDKNSQRLVGSAIALTVYLALRYFESNFICSIHMFY